MFLCGTPQAGCRVGDRDKRRQLNCYLLEALRLHHARERALIKEEQVEVRRPSLLGRNVVVGDLGENVTAWAQRSPDAL